MRHWRIFDALLLGAAALVSACVPEAQGAGAPQGAEAAAPTPQPPPPAPEPPLQKTVGEVFGKGVVITVSLASQQMHVFRDGVLWRSSPVSTGKRGKETPTGVFAILQKKTFHRSNLYSNAPMPFMQRLTWGGIAIHAGQLPGYPASHGCIRLPREFASELFKITGATTTAVIIVEGPLTSEAEAAALAKGSAIVVPIAPELLRRERKAATKPQASAAERLPATRTIPAPAGGGRQQTIQLAATLTPELAKAHFAQVSARRPELAGMQVRVIPAIVNGTQYYRLRLSAPGAHATCTALKRDGIDCFPVS